MSKLDGAICRAATIRGSYSGAFSMARLSAWCRRPGMRTLMASQASFEPTPHKRMLMRIQPPSRCSQDTHLIKLRRQLLNIYHTPAFGLSSTASRPDPPLRKSTTPWHSITFSPSNCIRRLYRILSTVHRRCSIGRLLRIDNLLGLPTHSLAINTARTLQPNK